MAKDIFGYDSSNTTQKKAMASSNGVVFSIDNKDVLLCQSVTINYEREVRTQYAIGSETAYVTVGHPHGTCEIRHLVGVTKFLEPYKNGTDDTECKGVKLSITSKQGTCSAAGGTATCEGAILQKVGITVEVQNLTVADSAVYWFSSLSISGSGS